MQPDPPGKNSIPPRTALLFLPEWGIEFSLSAVAGEVYPRKIIVPFFFFPRGCPLPLEDASLSFPAVLNGVFMVYLPCRGYLFPSTDLPCKRFSSFKHLLFSFSSFLRYSRWLISWLESLFASICQFFFLAYSFSFPSPSFTSNFTLTLPFSPGLKRRAPFSPRRLSHFFLFLKKPPPFGLYVICTCQHVEPPAVRRDIFVFF